MILEGDALMQALASLAHAATGPRAADAGRMLAAARRLRRIFSLPMPDAPGLVFVGGEVESAGRPTAGSALVSVAGSGADLLEAAVSCLGEAVEAMSRQDHGRPLSRVPLSDFSATGLTAAERAAVLAMLPQQAASAAAYEWRPAHRWPSQAEVFVPAQLCFASTHASTAPLVPASLGCGAGSAFEHALRHGLLEVIERDAIALWWLGGEAARALAPHVDATARDYLSSLRQSQAGRPTRLLDITADTGVPCCVAVSSDDDGRALAFGFAARLTIEAACAAAIREMCQMELGLRLISMKRQQRGPDSLNDADRLFLARAFTIDAADVVVSDRATRPPDDISLDQIASNLEALGCSVLIADLTPPDLAIPAARVLVPGLQPYPSALVTPRLQRVIDRNGGGLGLSRGLRLM